MPILAFLIAVTFIPGLASAATTPRWALLALALPWMLWRAKPAALTEAHLFGALFLAYATLSLLWTMPLTDGLGQLWLFLLLAAAFCRGTAMHDLRGVYIGAALGCGVNSAVVIAQWYGFDGIGQIIVPAGLFFNKNFVAEFAALIFIALISLRLWWFVPCTIPILVLCQSKASLMAIGAVGVLRVWHWDRRIGGALAAIFVLGGIWLWSGYDSAAQRIQLWQDTVAGLTFWGNGIGSYFSLYPAAASRIDALSLRPTAAHNDLLQLTFELGVGVVFFVAMLCSLLRPPWRTEHYVLVAFLVEGAVGFPLYLPATAFIAALVGGSLCRGRPDIRGALAWCRVRVFPGPQDREFAR